MEVEQRRGQIRTQLTVIPYRGGWQDMVKRFRLRFDSTWRYSKSGYISGPIDPKFYKKQLRDVKVPLE